jgi:hypothetical protein
LKNVYKNEDNIEVTNHEWFLSKRKILYWSGNVIL